MPRRPDPAAIEIVETHTATLFLTADRVYKLKKAVRLPFVDLSTRERRLMACAREVVINRRFAPDVYLGVATLDGPDGDPVDHLVVMRRLPAARTLASLAHSPESVERVREVAKAVSRMHASAPVRLDIAFAGTREHVARLWGATIMEMRAYEGGTLPPGRLPEIEARVARYLAGRGRLFDARIAQGRVHDGHGDLLAADIFCMPDGPRILDCLEFDDALRYGDALLDVAFLAMDLERLGRADLSALLLREYTRHTGDRFPASLAAHYIAYRALVRSKVACIRSGQGGAGAAAEAAALLDMSIEHLRRGAVSLTLVGGAPGSGKTTLARALAARSGGVVLRSDEIRKELAGLPATARAAAPYRYGLYRPAMTGSTYREMLARARRLLELGYSVVLDATWSDASRRVEAGKTAAAAHADLHQIECRAPTSLIHRRIAARDGDASDATAAIADAIIRDSAEWPGAFRVDTSGDADAAVRAAEAAIAASPLRTAAQRG